MSPKFTAARLLAVFAAAAPLIVILLAVQCSSITVMDGPAGDGAMIADFGVGDAAVITDSRAGDDLSPVVGKPAVLGSAQSFSVLAGQTVTSTGGSSVTGNLGVSPGIAITGFPPGTVTQGTIHAGDTIALQAQLDLTTAYNALRAEACTSNLTNQELSGLTLKPGVFCFAAAAAVTPPTHLVLDAQGDPDAVFIFQIGSTLTVGNNTAVRVINGGSDCNVYWQVGSSATVGTGTAFAGNILAFSSITLMTGASVSGRVLARNAVVTMDTNGVSSAKCTVVPATADLAIMVTSGQPFAAPGSTFVYQVTVLNRGPNDVQNVAMTSQLIATGGPAPPPVTWTCSATASAQCAQAGGTGNINANVNLAVGGTAVFVVTVSVPPQGSGTLEYRAQVAPSASVPDPNLTNNNAAYSVSITANGMDMTSGDASADLRQFHEQLSGGGFSCNATGAGSSASALCWGSMLVLGALARLGRFRKTPTENKK